jgi:predicted MFS family arabinose efflux permease
MTSIRDVVLVIALLTIGQDEFLLGPILTRIGHDLGVAFRLR